MPTPSMRVKFFFIGSVLMDLKIIVSVLMAVHCYTEVLNTKNVFLNEVFARGGKPFIELSRKTKCKYFHLHNTDILVYSN